MGRRRKNVNTESSIRVLCSKTWKRKVRRFAEQLGKRELSAEGNMSEVMRRATNLYMSVGIDDIEKLETFAAVLARDEEDAK